MIHEQGASPAGDRATDASHEAPAGLRHTVGIPSAEDDPRPEIAPDCFSFRELPEDGDVTPLMQEIAGCWRDQVEYARWTIVSPEYPNPPYPDGLYFEGWSIAPYHYAPPGKAAPFNYPLTATASGTLTEGGDAKQAPGESLSGPTAESGDAQGTQP